MCRPLLAALVVPLAPLVSAGTLTVGPAGSGAQFTEIQAAIDAALADDVILVKPGLYQPITVSKPLRILGDGTGRVRIENPPQIGAEILGIVGARSSFSLAWNSGRPPSRRWSPSTVAPVRSSSPT